MYSMPENIFSLDIIFSFINISFSYLIGLLLKSFKNTPNVDMI